jgi:hypothetical protein
MNPGDAFNSHKRLVQIMIPKSLPQLVGRGGLSWFDLVLYGRLQLHKAIDADSCHVYRETLASELHTSIDTVDRGLAALVKAGLISRKRRGPGHENQYTFLWCAALTGSLRGKGNVSPESATLRSHESADLRSQGADESAELRPMSPQPCGSESADLRSDIKEEKIPEKNPEKITAAAAAIPAHPDLAAWPAAAAAVRLQFPTSDDHAIEKIIQVAQGTKPDITDEGLAWAIERATKRKQESAMLYVRTIPEVLKSAGIEANLLYRAASEEAEREQAQKKAEFDAAMQAIDERRRRALLCKKCQGQGVVCLPGLLIAWCDCDARHARQAREPEYVEQYNADMERIAASFKPNGKPKRTAPDPIRDDADFERQRAKEIPEEERVSGDE